METSHLAGKDEAKAEQKKLKDVDLETRLKMARERETLTVQIKKIDVIYNPEYDILT